MSTTTVSAIKAFVEKNFRFSDSQAVPKRLDPVIVAYEKSPATFEFANDTGKNFVLAPQDGVLKDSEQRLAVSSLLRLHAHHIELTSMGRVKDLITNSEQVCSLERLRMFFGGELFAKKYAAKSKINPVSFGDTVNVELVRKRKAETDLEPTKKTKSKKAKDPTASDSDNDSSDSEEEGARAHTGSTIVRNEKRAAKKAKTKENNNRYLLFVGNLPYDTDADKIKKMFDRCEIIDVRIPRDKLTQQPKGFAFVEFGNAPDLNHALGFHKTLVDGRRINVELTAGGGGNSKSRRLKIAKKQQELALERHKKLAAMEGQTE